MAFTDLVRKSRYVPKDIKKMRLSICSTCQYLNKIKQCTRCGCFVNLKTSLTTEICPENKWHRFDNDYFNKIHDPLNFD